jgi:predicted RND superfamily exporter protein
LYFHRNMVEDDSISFDRIDSTKGYSVDNLIVISYRANKLKSDATLEEMRKIVNFYEKLNSQV